MKSYLIKNKKYTFMILFFICLFFFTDNAYAIIKQKSTFFNPTWSTRSKTGSINSGSWAGVDFELSSNLTLNKDYDYIGIQLNNLDFKYNENISVSGTLGGECSTYRIDHYFPGSGGTNNMIYNQMVCTSYTSSSGNTLTGTINNQGKVYDYYVLMEDSGGTLYSCTLTNETQNVVFCPTKNGNNAIIMKKVIFYMTNYADSTTLNYKITLDDVKGYYNDGSTDIVNALSILSTNQVQTTTTIQNFNNYVSNTDTTTSTANSNTALGGMNTEFSSHLSQMNELTQLTILPITFINNLLNNTCQPLVWDIPFVNSRVVVPCMSTIYNGYFSTFVGVFSLIMTSLLGYRAFIKLFNAIKGIVDAEDDKLEVVDL